MQPPVGVFSARADGATTIAVGLAACLSAQGRTLLIDLNLDSPEVAPLLDVGSSRTLYHLAYNAQLAPVSAEELEEERRLCYVGVTRAMKDLYLTSARTRAVFGARTYGIPSRFISEIPPELTDRDEQAPQSAVGRLRARVASWTSAADAAPTMAFRLGDDVVHPAFGEGVVTGIEPGGIVVIRFAKDRMERKLVADLAPITKR